MKKERQIIEECKALLEQNEPFQRKMKAKHSRMKKRVIGHGGQSNTPPYSEKPSMERSKSAPPIGENIDDELNEAIGKKLLGILGALGLAFTGAKAGASATEYTKKVAAAEQQFQQELSSKQKVQNELEKYRKKYNIFTQDMSETNQLKQNFINAYDLKNVKDADKIADAFLQDIQFGTYGSVAAIAQLREASALIKMTNPKLTGPEVLQIAFEDVMMNNRALTNKLKAQLDV